MRKIVVVEHLSLDGVMQAPGRPDEDRTGGFTHGGWAAADIDDVMMTRMAKGMGGAELRFGRRAATIRRGGHEPNLERVRVEDVT